MSSRWRKNQLTLIKDFPFQADNNAAHSDILLLHVRLFIAEFHPLKYCFLTHSLTRTHNTHTHSPLQAVLFPAAVERSPFPHEGPSWHCSLVKHSRSASHDWVLGRCSLGPSGAGETCRSTHGCGSMERERESCLEIWKCDKEEKEKAIKKSKAGKWMLAVTQ